MPDSAASPTFAAPTAPARPTDRPAKLARLHDLLDRHEAPAVALTSVESLGWLLDGARVTIPVGGTPVLAAVVDRDGVHVRAFANEVERLAAEELAGVELSAVAWHEPLLVPGPGVLTEADPVVAADLRAARATLLPVERARYAALGAEVASATTHVLRDARPTTTERELAAELARAVVGLGADAVVLLVAGADRTALRHPLPTTAPLGNHAIAVVGARRHGLFVNLTRWISFGLADPDRTARRLFEVEADTFAATVPGRTLAQVLADVAASYERHGFGPDAWLGHHQGGPTGYLGRDPRATPTATERVAAGQAFSWNPSAPGAKVEDTVVVDAGPGPARIEVLTVDPAWPAVEVRGVARPLTLALD